MEGLPPSACTSPLNESRSNSSSINEHVNEKASGRVSAPVTEVKKTKEKESIQGVKIDVF